MKKLSLFAVVLLSAVVVNAQELDGSYYIPPIFEEVTRAVVILFGMYLVGSFLLTVFFLSIGAGFVLVNVTLPLGIHSIAILCFCIAFGYLAYYFFVRKNADK
jgi:hypothetical protein